MYISFRMPKNKEWGKKGFAPYEEGLQQLDAGGVSAFTHLISVCYRF